MVVRGRLVGIVFSGFVAMALGGCAMPNSSNPTLAVTRAQVSPRSATLDIEIANASDYDLTLTGIEYTVVMGPLPVADGTWTGSKFLPMDSTVTITLPVVFDSAPLDPNASELEFSGFMTFGDSGNRGSMEIGEASFNETARVEH